MATMSSATGAWEPRFQWTEHNFTVKRKEALDGCTFETKSAEGSTRSRWRLFLEEGSGRICVELVWLPEAVESISAEFHVVGVVISGGNSKELYTSWREKKFGTFRVNSQLELDNTWTIVKKSGTFRVNSQLKLDKSLGIVKFRGIQTNGVFEIKVSLRTGTGTACQGVAKKNLALLRGQPSSEFDVTIKCADGKEFKCHRVILAGRSPVFERMFQSGFQEADTGVVNVTDVGGKTMALLIGHLYKGQLPGDWRKEVDLVELLYAAGKYELQELLEYLDKKLVSAGGDEQVDANVLMDLLNLAVKLKLTNAERGLKDEIVKLAMSAGDGEALLTLFYKQ